MLQTDHQWSDSLVEHMIIHFIVSEYNEVVGTMHGIMSGFVRNVDVFSIVAVLYLTKLNS